MESITIPQEEYRRLIQAQFLADLLAAVSGEINYTSDLARIAEAGRDLIYG